MNLDLGPALTDAQNRVRPGQSRLVAVVRTARMDVDPAALYTEDGPASFVWQQPDRDVHIVGHGVAAEVVAPADAGRFRVCREAIGEIVGLLTVVHADRSPMEPVFIGGFSFAASTDWGMGPGRLVLPELSYIRRDGRAAWIRCVTVDESTDLAMLEADLERQFAHLDVLGGGWRPPLSLPGSQPIDPGDQEYPKLVRQALDAIDRGQVDKVVVARSADLDAPFDVVGVLATLRDRFPGCVTFAFRFDDELFLGATPELLARVRHGLLHTAAVAGTAPRGEGFDEDHALGNALLVSDKDRREHAYVYREIRTRLATVGVDLDDERPPEVLKLAGLQHLWTRVTGEIAEDTSPLDVVEALHPTSAVAGLPAVEAREWLDAHEGLDRGWYAGPVGFLDTVGDGEFHVALRSAYIDGSRARLFAGAGIVAGSDPGRELAETELKFQAVGRAIRAAS